MLLARSIRSCRPVKLQHRCTCSASGSVPAPPWASTSSKVHQQERQQLDGGPAPRLTDEGALHRQDKSSEVCMDRKGKRRALELGQISQRQPQPQPQHHLHTTACHHDGTPQAGPSTAAESTGPNNTSAEQRDVKGLPVSDGAPRGRRKAHLRALLGRTDWRAAEEVWTAFCKMRPEARRRMKASVLREIVVHQWTTWKQSQNTADPSPCPIATLWKRSTRYLSAINDNAASPKLDAALTAMALRAASISLNAYSATTTGKPSDLADLDRNARAARLHALFVMQMYQFLLFRGIFPATTFLSHVTTAQQILKFESVPFPALREIARRKLAIYDMPKRDRRPELEALKELSVLSTASLSQLFRLSLELRDVKLAKPLYVLLRTAVEEDNRVRWSSADTARFSTFFNVLVRDAVYLKNGQTREEQARALEFAHSLFHDWEHDGNSVPQGVVRKLLHLIAHHACAITSEDTWLRLLRQQPGTFSEEDLLYFVQLYIDGPGTKGYMRLRRMWSILIAEETSAHVLSQETFKAILSSFPTSIPAADLTFAEIWHDFRHFPNVIKDADLYNVWFRYWQDRHEVGRVIRQKHTDMMKEGIAMNEETYRLLYRAYRTRGKMLHAAQVAEAASQLGLIVDRPGDTLLAATSGVTAHLEQADHALHARLGFDVPTSEIDAESAARSGASVPERLTLADQRDSRPVQGFLSSFFTANELAPASTSSKADQVASQAECEESVNAAGTTGPALRVDAREERSARRSDAPAQLHGESSIVYRALPLQWTPSESQMSGNYAFAFSTAPSPPATSSMAPIRRTTIKYPDNDNLFSFRRLHQGLNLDNLLEMADQARAEIERQSTSQLHLELAHSRQRWGNADAARWQGWGSYAATPWY